MRKKSPNAADLVIEWIKYAYKLPENISFTIENDGEWAGKWKHMIIVTEDWGDGHDIGGYRTGTAHHFNLLAWDGEQGFLGINYRKKPLYISDPGFFEKLKKTIINPTFKNFLYFPSNVFYSKSRRKI